MRLSNRIASRLGLKTDRIERFVAVARAAILWERAWLALWPASGILGLYLAAALFDIFSYLPGFLHVLLPMATAAGVGLALYRGLRDFAPPDWRDGARRLERDSTLRHRPITERDDDLAAGRGDAWAEALWRAHVRQLLAGIAHLRVAWPSPGLPAKDPYALRFIVLLVLVAGAAVAGPDWNRRIAGALLPAPESGGPAATLDAWIDPPAYTGEAPVYLERTANKSETVAVPAGSMLVLRVHRADAAPRLSLDPAPDKTSGFKGASSEYGADVRLRQNTEIVVHSGGRTLGHWRIKTVADTPPAIAFSAPPSRTERNAVKFSYTAGDDYGIAKARAIVRPVKRMAKTQKPLIVDLPVESVRAKTLQQTTYRDLTEHPFAGLDVTIVLEAVDGVGQTGRSKPVAFHLPARVFTDPLARALIEQRQNLALGEFAARPKAERTLDALTIAPERFYLGRTGIYLAVRAAYWALRAAHARRDFAHIEALLWQTAVALEDGRLPAAAQELRRLQQLLSEALARGAPQAAIDELLQRYSQALDRYLKELAQNAQRSNAPPPPNAKILSERDLRDLLNAIQELAQTGARGQAAQMLAMLQSLLENLHMNAGNGQGQPSPGDETMRDTIGKLGDLMGRQRQLLDKTYREGQDAGNPADGGGKGLAQQQGKLREDLNKVLKGLGDRKVRPPKSFGEAGRSMGEAEGELGRKDFDGAGDAQKNALEALRKGAGELAQNLMKQPGEGTQDGADEDPLGREGGRGSLLGGRVKVPDQSAIARARFILMELRKRAAERGRPKQELDYIDRLLKQF